jgi:preprotein translocase subunit SecA
VEEMIGEMVEGIVPEYVDEKIHPEAWDLKGLDERIFGHFALKLNLAEKGRDLAPKTIEETIIAEVKTHLRKKEKEFGTPLMDYLMKVIMLQSIDTQWKENLLAMDHLKEGIGLRGYGQKDPVREYQKEGYDMFMDMIVRVKEDTIQKLCIVQIKRGSGEDRGEETSGLHHVAGRGHPCGDDSPTGSDQSRP